MLLCIVHSRIYTTDYVNEDITSKVENMNHLHHPLKKSRLASIIERLANIYYIYNKYIPYIVVAATIYGIYLLIFL